MPGTFPQLRTGAIAQYPLSRQLAAPSETVRFLDGAEQHYRNLGPLRRWSIALRLLSAAELANLREFFHQQKGRWGAFAFTDPLSGITYPACSFADDAFPELHDGEVRAGVQLTVYEHA